MDTGAEGSRDFEPIEFPDWQTALGSAELHPALCERYRWAIRSFLNHCRRRAAPPSVATIRDFLRGTEPPVRDALRWFFREAQIRSESGSTKGKVLSAARARSDIPPTAAIWVERTGNVIWWRQ